MRHAVAAALAEGMFVLSGCTKEEPKGPVDQILEIGIQAENEIAETTAKRNATADLAEAVELGKTEIVLADSAKARMTRILGGANVRLPLNVVPGTDTLPVAFGHATIGLPDFYKGQFQVNLVISGMGKRALPEATLFHLVALDSAGTVLASKDASMVDSLRVGDSLYAGGIFRGSELRGLRALSAR